MSSATARNLADVPNVEAPIVRGSGPHTKGTMESLGKVQIRWQDNLSRVADTTLPFVVGLWLVGVLILTLRLTMGWMLIRRVCLSGLPIHDSFCLERFRILLKRMQIGVPVQLLESALVEVPTLVGWLRPTILVPASIFMGLTPDQLEAILAHELAHVRRYDYLMNLFQTVIETILFYHPAVWWISRKLRAERENCCDDIALEVMQDRLVYVSALAQLEEGRTLPLALTASGGSLIQRIRRIVGANDRKASAWPLWVLIIGILALVCLTKTHAQDVSKQPTLSKAVTQSPDFHTQMLQAVQKGDPVTLQKLIDQGDGPSMLLLASAMSNAPVMKWLLEHRVDPNALGILAVRSNAPPITLLPMQLAAGRGQIEAVKLLLEHGAKADDAMVTALHNRSDEVVKFLWDNGVRSVSELCYAVSQGAPVGDLQKLLDQGIPANPPQDKQITALGEAALLGNMDTVKLLVAHHADVNAGGPINPKLPQATRMSPLWLASSEGQDEIVVFLLQHGATAEPAAVGGLCREVGDGHPFSRTLSPSSGTDKPMKFSFDRFVRSTTARALNAVPAKSSSSKRRSNKAKLFSRRARAKPLPVSLGTPFNLPVASNSAPTMAGFGRAIV